MHLLATQPGGFVQDEGIIASLGQSPADIVILSAADTTLALLARSYEWLLAHEDEPQAWPSVRLANLMHLRQHASVDLYEQEVLAHARLVIVDHLGGEGYWPYGTARLVELAAAGVFELAMFSGDAHMDANLLRKSTLPVQHCQRLWAYLRAGGQRNACNALRWVRALWQQRLGAAQAAQQAMRQIEPPVPLEQVLVWHPQMQQQAEPRQKVPNDLSGVRTEDEGWAALDAHFDAWHRGTDPVWRWHEGAAVVLIVLYRAHVLAGNMEVFEALAAALLARGLNPLPLAVASLKDESTRGAIAHIRSRCCVQVVINTTSFARQGLGAAADGADEPLAGDAPVLQAIVSGMNEQAWAADTHGLGPRDVAMHVALPEVDGRIITRAISFKALARRSDAVQCDVVRYAPQSTHVDFVAELAHNYCQLRATPTQQRRMALILANYPNRSQAQMGAGVGLDTPQSVVNILHALRAQGYCVDGIAESGTALMQQLQAGITNAPQTWAQHAAQQSLGMEQYLHFFNRLEPSARQAVLDRWGAPERDPMLRQGRFLIAGLRLMDAARGTGGVFVGLQPTRVQVVSPAAVAPDALAATYHDPHIPPPHHYIAFYAWLRQVWGVHALIHCGKHGNLEWLPGKSVALSDACWPVALAGPVPHIYPFIVNDPGEGAQAKRRTHATIISHLMPALTVAGSHGSLAQLERLADEYYEALALDKRRAALLRAQIVDLAVQAHLHKDLGLEQRPRTPQQEHELIAHTDAWLCELKESQLRDGLHVFGRSPSGWQLLHTLRALVREPSPMLGLQGLTQALAQDLQLWADEAKSYIFDPLAGFEPSAAWTGSRPALLQSVLAERGWRNAAHTRERLEALALAVLACAFEREVGQLQPQTLEGSFDGFCRAWAQKLPRTAALIERVREHVLPRLLACGPQEMEQFLCACDGRFVSAGPSGAPTRGRLDVLPTGRNFYGIDPRATPTPAAWTLGQEAARVLLDKYLQDHGQWPRAVGLSLWGTATMRTGGEEFAQALALMGVRPRWSAASGRVEDFEILPLSALGRPRVDVTLRVSGFFRDAFENLLILFEAAVRAVASLSEESADDNPIRQRIDEESAALQRNLQLDAAAAQTRAAQRVFAPRAGSYGSGVGSVLDAAQWRTRWDLGLAWLQHSAFDREGQGTGDVHTLAQRIARLDLIAQHLDNPETDVLDSSEHAQFLGGMHSAAQAVRADPGHLIGPFWQGLSTSEPDSDAHVYVVDHTSSHSPRARSVAQEISRIVRTRLTNPRWHAAITRHGYKGGFEVLNAVEALFAFAATVPNAVRGDQFEASARALLLDATMAQFLRTHNPHALHQGCERMLEAAQRGLWSEPDAQTLAALQAQLLQLEDALGH